MSQLQKGKRIEYLDGLRGIAILGICLSHFLIPPKPGFFSFDYALANPLIYNFGAMRVPLFFIISGFVISLTIKNCSSIWEFGKRRWLRLFPSVFLISFIILWMQPLFPNNEYTKTPADLLPGILMIDSWFLNKLFGYQGNSISPVLWTLYIEVEFYFLFSLLYFTLRKFLLPTLLIMGLLIQPFRVFGFGGITAETIDAYSRISIFEHLPWFCFGIALYFIYKGEKKFMNLFILITSAIACLLHQKFSSNMLVNLMPLLIFSLPFYIPGIAKILAHRWLLFLGSISYPLYLIHYSIGSDAMHELRFYSWGGWEILQPPIFLVISIAVAWLIQKHWDNPIQRWIKKPTPPSRTN